MTNNENNCQNCNKNNNCIIYKLIKDKNKEELFISLYNLRCDEHSESGVKDREEFKKDVNNAINQLINISNKLNNLSRISDELSDELSSIGSEIDYFKDLI